MNKPACMDKSINPAVIRSVAFILFSRFGLQPDGAAFPPVAPVKPVLKNESEMPPLLLTRKILVVISQNKNIRVTVGTHRKH